MNTKHFLFASLAFNVTLLFVGGVFVARRGGMCYVYNLLKREPYDYARIASSAYRERVALLGQLPISSSSVIMMGDSLTEGGLWNEFFPRVSTHNRGVGRDTTSGILDRLPAYLDSHPKKIFVLIGINDLMRGQKVAEVENNIEKIAQLITSRSPKTELYLQSILPCTSAAVRSDEIVSVNRAIESICGKYGIVYLDLYRYFVDKNGQQETKLFLPDGIHLSADGYRRWRSILDGYVN